MSLSGIIDAYNVIACEQAPRGGGGGGCKGEGCSFSPPSPPQELACRLIMYCPQVMALLVCCCCFFAVTANIQIVELQMWRQ